MIIFVYHLVILFFDQFVSEMEVHLIHKLVTVFLALFIIILVALEEIP